MAELRRRISELGWVCQLGHETDSNMTRTADSAPRFRWVAWELGFDAHGKEWWRDERHGPLGGEDG